MPRELIAIAPREAVFRTYEDPDVGPQQVRVRSEFGSPKHGTELALFRGTSPSSVGRWDGDLRLTLDATSSEVPATGAGGGRRDLAPSFPMALGNMCVGVVEEVGSDVHGLAVGDRVYGHLTLRETHTVPERQVRRLPAGMTPTAAVCLDPALVAYTAVREARVRLGDRVAIFGLGAIGLIAVQLCVLSGASVAFAIDPIPRRREVAAAVGGVPLAPNVPDLALEIKRRTDRAGVDVAIEASGAYRALEQAIRSVRFGGLVASAALYPARSEEAALVAGLMLGGEWHRNQVTMISTRPSREPFRDHPRWDVDRVWTLCEDLLRSGRIHTIDIVQPHVTFAESASAYADIDRHPERSVKLGVVFGER
jgi:threonine dehydrogenase-like Zn-dependent dehydrogenase